MTTYALLKFVHIVSSTLLLGTGLGTAFFMWMTHRSGNITAIATATRITVLADWLFTTPAVIVQPVSGVLLMRVVGYPPSSSWLQAAIALYLLAGACWLPVVFLQMRMRTFSTEALRTGVLPAQYHSCMRWWFALGWPAFVAVVVTFWLMVAKPVLW
jgi:uncharacterized membrane protein